MIRMETMIRHIRNAEGTVEFRENTVVVNVRVLSFPWRREERYDRHGSAEAALHAAYTAMHEWSDEQIKAWNRTMEQEPRP